MDSSELISFLVVAAAVSGMIILVVGVVLWLTSRSHDGFWWLVYAVGMGALSGLQQKTAVEVSVVQAVGTALVALGFTVTVLNWRSIVARYLSKKFHSLVPISGPLIVGGLALVDGWRGALLGIAISLLDVGNLSLYWFVIREIFRRKVSDT